MKALAPTHSLIENAFLFSQYVQKNYTVATRLVSMQLKTAGWQIASEMNAPKEKVDDMHVGNPHQAPELGIIDFTSHIVVIR